MARTKSTSKFSVGDTVRVRPGVNDPDFPDIPFGGWTGTILEFEDSDPRTYHIQLNARTLRSIHPIYHKRCERDGLEADHVWMAEEDLEPDSGTPLEIEQPVRIVARSLSTDDQDDRVRLAHDLTSDDPLPESNEESLRAYYKYLTANLSFPFEAKYSYNRGGFTSKTCSITVLGLVDPENFPGEGYGLFCQARRGGERIELPLSEIEVGKGNRNRRFFEDYSYWFVNW